MHIHDYVLRIRKESKIHPKLRENYDNMMSLTEMWGTNSDEREWINLCPCCIWDASGNCEGNVPEATANVG